MSYSKLAVLAFLITITVYFFPGYGDNSVSFGEWLSATWVISDRSRFAHRPPGHSIRCLASYGTPVSGTLRHARYSGPGTYPAVDLPPVPAKSESTNSFVGFSLFTSKGCTPLSNTVGTCICETSPLYVMALYLAWYKYRTNRRSASTCSSPAVLLCRARQDTLNA